MIIGNLSKSIADSQRNSYIMGLIVGTVLYLMLLFSNDWNPILLITGESYVWLSVITGIVIRFISGLGIALAYATFCTLTFRILSPSIKGNKSKLRQATMLVLVPCLILVFYSMYIIWEALFLPRPLSLFEYLSTIFGIWSLMMTIYIIPLIKGEYTPDLEQAKNEGVHHRVSKWKFTIWKGYQSRIRKDYGHIAEKEFDLYGARLFIIRAILSGFLLIPISIILVTITPLAVLSVILWIRIFSLSHKHFSEFERGMLILITGSVAVLATITFTDSFLAGFNPFFGTFYGIGLLIGLFLLVYIILQK